MSEIDEAVARRLLKMNDNEVTNLKSATENVVDGVRMAVIAEAHPAAWSQFIESLQIKVKGPHKKLFRQIAAVILRVRKDHVPGIRTADRSVQSRYGTVIALSHEWYHAGAPLERADIQSDDRVYLGDMIDQQGGVWEIAKQQAKLTRQARLKTAAGDTEDRTAPDGEPAEPSVMTGHQYARCHDQGQVCLGTGPPAAQGGAGARPLRR